MHRAQKPRPITTDFTRAGVVICMIAVLVGSVTFAALRSQNNYLRGSTLTTATLELQMSKQQYGTYTDTLDGYDFNSAAANGPAVPVNGHDLYVKNLGSTDLDVQVSLDASRLSNVNHLDLHQVFLVLTDVTNGGQPVKYNLADLDGAYRNGAPLSFAMLNSAATSHFSVQMQLGDIDLSTTTQVALYGLDFVLSGENG